MSSAVARAEASEEIVDVTTLIGSLHCGDSITPSPTTVCNAYLASRAGICSYLTVGVIPPVGVRGEVVEGMVDVRDLFLENIIPGVGVVVATTLFGSPLRAVFRVRKSQELGVWYWRGCITPVCVEHRCCGSIGHLQI